MIYGQIIMLFFYYFVLKVVQIDMQIQWQPRNQQSQLSCPSLQNISSLFYYLNIKCINIVLFMIVPTGTDKDDKRVTLICQLKS